MTRTVVQLEPLWTIEDVAVYLRVPVQTLYQWRRKGIGPPAKKCGRTFGMTRPLFAPGS